MIQTNRLMDREGEGHHKFSTQYMCHVLWFIIDSLISVVSMPRSSTKPNSGNWSPELLFCNIWLINWSFPKPSKIFSFLVDFRFVPPIISERIRISLKLECFYRSFSKYLVKLLSLSSFKNLWHKKSKISFLFYSHIIWDGGLNNIF